MDKLIPQWEVFGSFAEEEERPAVFGNVSDTSSGIDFPLAEGAEFSFDDHG